MVGPRVQLQCLLREPDERRVHPTRRGGGAGNRSHAKECLGQRVAVTEPACLAGRTVQDRVALRVANEHE